MSTVSTLPVSGSPCFDVSRLLAEIMLLLARFGVFVDITDHNVLAAHDAAADLLVTLGVEPTIR